MLMEMVKKSCWNQKMHPSENMRAQRLVEKSINSVADLAIYKSKRDLMFNKLTSFGYEIVKPTGGFYLFPKSPINDVDFCNTLKQEKILKLIQIVDQHPVGNVIGFVLFFHS